MLGLRGLAYTVTTLLGASIPYLYEETGRESNVGAYGAFPKTGIPFWF